MHELLTLAMAETRPGTGEFTVLAAETSSMIIVPLHLKKEDIISDTGEACWDIGRVTRAEIKEYIPQNSDNRNKGYTASNATIISEYDEHALKECLSDLAGTYSKFVHNIKSRFLIVKANEVKNLSFDPPDSNGSRKCRMDVVLANDPGKTENLLNKDYRWVSYWQHVSDDAINEHKTRYLSLLNRSGKTVYLILYKHFFSSGPKVWISGMHWL